jgi:hypothetical protein
VSPKIKDPTIFTARIPTGKEYRLRKYLSIRNLAGAPMPAPRTKRTTLMLKPYGLKTSRERLR